MIDNLNGSPLPCDPSNRTIFKYFAYGERVKMSDGQQGGSDTSKNFGDLVKPPVGSWYWLNPGESPYIVCPRCGNAGRLGNHTVNARGEINPSIVCPMQSCGDGVARCDAHYYGRLEGYMFAGPKS